MLFKKQKSIPALQKENNPDWEKLKVTKGFIKRWILFFPVEAADKAHIVVEYHGARIFPVNADESMYGGGYFFNIEEDLELEKEPYDLDIYGWNSDTKKAHEYNLHVVILRKEPVKPSELGEEEAEELGKLLGG